MNRFGRTLIAGVAAALLGTSLVTGAPSAGAVEAVTAPLNASHSTEAEAGAHPFSVALVPRTLAADSDPDPFCTGSLIHPSWALTAAHCVTVDAVGNDRVRESLSTTFPVLAIGRSDLTDANTGGEEITADRFVVHPGWMVNTNDSISTNDRNDWTRDLALVHLSRPSAMQPVGIVTPWRTTELEISAADDPMRTLGYGRTSDTTTGASDQLRQGETTITSVPTPTGTARSTFEHGAGELQCRGDSGGPWLVKHPDGAWRQFALASDSIKSASGSSSSSCGNPALGASLRSQSNYDFIYQNIYAGYVAGRWLRRPIASNGTLDASTYLSADWRSGWTIHEFFPIAGKPYMLLYREDDGTVRIQPLNPDGTPSSSVAYESDWTDDWTSIRPYTIGGKTFFFMMKSGAGTAAVNEVVINATTGKITLAERFREAWTSGWTTAEPFKTGSSQNSATGLLLLKEATGQIKTMSLTSTAPYVAFPGAGKAMDTAWSTGWSHARFFRTATKSYLLIMKDSTGEVHIHEMSGLLVGTRFQDENVHARWGSVEFSRVGSTTYLMLHNRYDGGQRTFAMNEAPIKNRMLGAQLPNYNAQGGYTQTKPYCIGNLSTDTTQSCSGKLYSWMYREGSI